MTSRIRQFIPSFKQKDCDAFLVTKDVNIRYLTGFPASESWLLIHPKKSFYITDFRYVLEAKKGLKGIMVYRYPKSMAQGLFDLAKRMKIKRLGLDSRHLSHASYQKLEKVCRGKVKFTTIFDSVEQLRDIKSSQEIALIRKALKLNLDAYRFIKKAIKPGISERSLFNKLEAFVKSHKAEFSFPAIIASGPNSCLPHAKITDRIIKKDDIVLIDMGMDIDGYKSDLTRVFFLGKIPPLVRQVCADVAKAQQLAIEKIRPGIAANEVDFQARNHLAKRKLAKYFGHSLGHGVGLEIHETPSISSQSSALLREGMVFTVEPGVYLPNKFGIRIEDMVLVTSKGCEVLSRNTEFDQKCP